MRISFCKRKSDIAGKYLKTQQQLLTNAILNRKLVIKRFRNRRFVQICNDCVGVAIYISVNTHTHTKHTDYVVQSLLTLKICGSIYLQRGSRRVLGLMATKIFNVVTRTTQTDIDFPFLQVKCLCASLNLRLYSIHRILYIGNQGLILSRSQETSLIKQSQGSKKVPTAGKKYWFGKEIPS